MRCQDQLPHIWLKLLHSQVPSTDKFFHCKVPPLDQLSTYAKLHGQHRTSKPFKYKSKIS